MSHDARELPEFMPFRKPQVQQGTAAGMLAPPPDCPASLTRSTARGAPTWLLLLSLPGETLVRAALNLDEGHLSPPAPVAGADTTALAAAPVAGGLSPRSCRVPSIPSEHRPGPNSKDLWGRRGDGVQTLPVAIVLRDSKSPCQPSLSCQHS